MPWFSIPIFEIKLVAMRITANRTREILVLLEGVTRYGFLCIILTLSLPFNRGFSSSYFHRHCTSTSI